ncbi:hypothetical protein O5585_27680, partial [Escherichia coli]|nr:hypothetical protein [Escherichia coli]
YAMTTRVIALDLDGTLLTPQKHHHTSRVVSQPISGVYFSWDTDGLGYDQGVWQGSNCVCGKRVTGCRKWRLVRGCTFTTLYCDE